MRIGIPREIMPLEGRVALTPGACETLVLAGHSVFIEAGAGELSGYSDALYQSSGTGLAADAEALYVAADLIVKVKEPLAAEIPYLHSQHLLFCFLHLAAKPALARQLCDIGLTAIGFETVEEAHGNLPLLAPMSAIAGRIATQVGAYLLHQPQGGKGLLLGGIGTTESGRVVVIGAGSAGRNAAEVAAALGAEVKVFDLRQDRLAEMNRLSSNITASLAEQSPIDAAVSEADLVIGAALRTGAEAPHIVSRQTVASMQPGSVIVDISVDQGGCIETTRPTRYDNPTYLEEGVIHFAVTNMPGAVPRSATQALSHVLQDYVLKLASPDWQMASPALTRGINIAAGKFIYPALIEAFAK